MIKLNSARKLQAVMAAAVTSAAPTAAVSYNDKTSTTFDGDMQMSTLTGTTPVDICNAPASGAVRHIDKLTLRNWDSVQQVVTVRVNEGGTVSKLIEATLEAGELVGYTHAEGWYVNSADGSRKSGAVQDLSGYLRVDTAPQGLSGTEQDNGRTNLGLGNAATKDVGTTAGTVAAGDDSRLSDTRTPTDATVTEAKFNLSDVTTGNASASKHGLLPKLSGSSSDVLKGDGTWGAGGGGGSPGGSSGQVQYNNAGAFAGIGGSSVSGQTVTFDALRVSAGSTTVPAIAPSGDTTTGLSWPFSSWTAVLSSGTAVALWGGGSQGRLQVRSGSTLEWSVNSITGDTHVALAAESPGVLKVVEGLNGATTNLRDIKFRALTFGATYTVGTLPSAATVGDGYTARVSDLTTPTLGAAPTGGGSTKGLVTSNGSSYTVSQFG